MKRDEFLKLLKEAEKNGGSIPRAHKDVTVTVKDSDDEKRRITFVASTEDVDRDNDTIRVDGWSWKNFLKNPVMPWGHNYSLPPVARIPKVWIEDKALMIEAEFPTVDTVGENSFEDKIYKMYRDKFLNTVSVGFNPTRYEWVERDKGAMGIDFIEQELWEVSACTIPSNPNAVMVRAKDAGILTDDDIEILTKWQKTPGQEVDIMESAWDSFAEALAENFDKEIMSKVDDPPEYTAIEGIDGDRETKNEITLDVISDQMSELINIMKATNKHILKLKPKPADPDTGADPDQGGHGVDDDEIDDDTLKTALETMNQEPEPDHEEMTEEQLTEIVATAASNALKRVTDRVGGIEQNLGIVDPNSLKFKKKSED